MLHHRGIICIHHKIRLYGKGIFLSIGVDNDPVAIFQLVQVDTRAGQAAGKLYMPREDTVAIPGWESASFQPASLIPQPGEVPRAISIWHAHHRYLEI